MKKFKGIYPALITPFDEKGRINPEMVQKVVDSCLAKGVSGFYVGNVILSVIARKRNAQPQRIGAGNEFVHNGQA